MATLEITNSAGTVTGTVSNPLEVSCTDRASAIGEMAFSVYVGSPGASSLAPGTYVKWTDGSYSFWGIVETVTRNEQEDGTAVLAVVCSDIARELVWFSALGTEFSSGGMPILVQDALDRIETLAWTWTLTAGADLAGVTVYLAADGASVWTLLLSLADKLGVFIIRGAGRSLTLTGTFTASGVTARSVSGDKPAGVAALLSLTNDLSGREVINQIVPFTAGNAAVRLSLQQASESPPPGIAIDIVPYVTGTGTRYWYVLKEGESIFYYGTRTRVVQFPEISPLSNSKPDITAAANALQKAAVQYLRDHAKPQRVLRLVMDDAATIVGPLQTVIVNHGGLNAAFRVLEAMHNWQPNLPVRSTLMLNDGGQLPASGADAVVTSIEQARAYRAHAQLAPNVYQLAFNKPVDAQYGADFRFRFDTALTQLLFVALDVQIGPLQSTVRAVGAEGVKTGAHTQAAHTHTGPSHTHTGPSHTHPMTFAGHSHVGGVHTHGMTTIAHVHSIEVTKVSTAGSDFNDVRLNAASPNNFQVTVGSGAGSTVTTPTQSTGGAGTDTGNGGNVATAAGLIGTLNTDAAGTGATGAGGAAATTADGGFTHDHTVDVAVTMEYGIYRESAANTFALADLEYQVNGGAWAALTGATSLGDGWYRLEMTAALCDAVTFTPIALSNRVSIRSALAAASDETFAVGTVGSGTVPIWNDAGVYGQILSGAAVQALAISSNGWLYRLIKAAGQVEVYQPNDVGTLVLWATWAVTAATYNAIAVDARTGRKWWAGINGNVQNDQFTLKVIAGSPTLTTIAAFGGNVYVSGASSIWRINTNIFGSPVTGIGAGTSAGLAMAALSSGAIVQLSSSAAAFQLKVWAADLSAFVLYTRSDAGNVWTPLSIASGANLVHVGCSDGRVRTYSLEGTTATLIWTSTGTPGATGYPASTSLLAVRAVLSSKAANIDAQLTVRSVVQAIVMN